MNVKTIHKVDRYVYLRMKTAKDCPLILEVKRRIVLFGRLFEKLHESTLGTRRKLFDQCVLQVVTFGSESWLLNTTISETCSGSKMERILLSITLRDRKSNTWIRQ